MQTIIVKRKVPKTISVMEMKDVPLYVTESGTTFENPIRAEEHEKEIQKAIDYYELISTFTSLEHLRAKYWKYEECRDEWLATEKPENFLAWQYGLKKFLESKGYKIS